MARLRPRFASPRFAQKQADILIDDGFLRLLTKDPLQSPAVFRIIDKAFRKAAVKGANSIKTHITGMGAVATGFMRKSVTFSVEANRRKKPQIQATFGTKAWYDILVHEGLGRHGGQRTIPIKYHPTEEQLAIIEPSPEERLSFYKPSPRVPRPFLTRGIKAVRSDIANTISTGVKKAMRKVGSARGTPRHSLKTVSFGGTRSL